MPSSWRITSDLQIVAGEDLVGAALQRSERIQVVLPSDGTLPVGRLDFVEWLRVLCNLLENALLRTLHTRAGR